MPKYGMKQIAKELADTANEIRYVGNALYVAMDMPSMSVSDKEVLLRYLHREETESDKFKLLEISDNLSRVAEYYCEGDIKCI